MPYNIPYLIVAFLLTVLCVVEFKSKSRLTKRLVIWSAYILMWLFIGLRGHVMTDFIIYYPYFEEYPSLLNLSSSSFLNAYEPGFNLYTAIFKTFTDNYFCWVAFNTTIDLIVFSWFFRKYCRSMILPLIFLMAFNGLLMEFNLFRNMKAIDLFLISIPYLQQRRVIPYMLLNLLGVLFHSSAVIYLPLYFVLGRQISKYIVWGVVIVANLMFVLNVTFIGNILNNLDIIRSLAMYDKLSTYGEEAQKFTLSFGYLERTLTFILFTWLLPKLRSERKENLIFYNCYWLYYCITLVFFEVSVFVERFSYLFIFSYWVLYSNVFCLKYRQRDIVNMGISLLVFLKIFLSYGSKGEEYSNIIVDDVNYTHSFKKIRNLQYDQYRKSH